MKKLIMAIAGYLGVLTGLFIGSTFFFWIFCWAFRIPFTWRRDIGIWAALMLIRTVMRFHVVYHPDTAK